jgi:hypothetical protein
VEIGIFGDYTEDIYFARAPASTVLCCVGETRYSLWSRKLFDLRPVARCQSDSAFDDLNYNQGDCSMYDSLIMNGVLQASFKAGYEVSQAQAI